MFTSVLIANRGEIACRLPAPQAAGLRTIRGLFAGRPKALHVPLCDEATSDWAGTAAQSYLVIEQTDRRRQGVARRLHPPRLRFFSENAAFAKPASKPTLCSSPAALGDERHGPEGPRQDADGKGRRAGVPAITATCRSRSFSSRKAYEIGYPVLIKAWPRRRQGHAPRSNRTLIRRGAVGRDARGQGASATSAC